MIVSPLCELSLEVPHKVLPITPRKPRPDMKVVAHEDEEGQVDVVFVSRPGEAAPDDGVHRAVGTEQESLLSTPIRQKVEGVRILMSNLSGHAR